jgi:hypothetical protein
MDHVREIKGREVLSSEKEIVLKLPQEGTISELNKRRKSSRIDQKSKSTHLVLVFEW